MILKFQQYITESINSFAKSKKSEKREEGLMTRVYDNGVVKLVCSIPYSEDINSKEEVMWDCVFTSKLGKFEKKMKYDAMRNKFESLTSNILSDGKKSED